LVRRSNFRHQASPRASPCASTQQRQVELWARNVRKFCLNVDFHVTFRDLLHAVKLRRGTDGFTSPPKEGVLRISFALKIRRLRLGVNPRTWVPKASTLPLDHRSSFTFTLQKFHREIIKQKELFIYKAISVHVYHSLPIKKLLKTTQ
jgi:hypothetical protein